MSDSPAYLVAIAYAAWRSGDRLLVSAARQKLQERFGIKITLPKNRKAMAAGHANQPG